uniref:Chromosome 16 open reading frame 87 n=1 Tax=Cyprinus carpio TaxID=7962 RepID=A0A8C1VZC3_CYPCA
MRSLYRAIDGVSELLISCTSLCASVQLEVLQYDHRGQGIFLQPVVINMSTNKVKKVKMATKSCPECDQQIPVACKSCPCGYVFISRKLLNAKLNERSPVMDQLDAKRRRTERIRKEKINLTPTSDMENRRRPRSNSQSDPIRRGRGRPKTVGLKKQEEEKEKQEKEVDMYANLSDEKAFVFSVALAEINRKILGQRLIL